MNTSINKANQFCTLFIRIVYTLRVLDAYAICILSTNMVVYAVSACAQKVILKQESVYAIPHGFVFLIQKLENFMLSKPSTSLSKGIYIMH